MHSRSKKYLIAITVLCLLIPFGYVMGQQEPSQDAQRSPQAAKERFVGTWKLVSWEMQRSDGKVIEPILGRDAVAWVMFDANGRMCAQLMRQDRPNFSTNDMRRGTPEEVKAAYEGYIAYCGTYTVNEEEGYLVTHVELSLFPNWLGTDQKRFFEFSEDRMTLMPPPTVVAGQQVISRLTWERLK